MLFWYLLGQPVMAIDGIHFEGWRVAVLHDRPGWKALVYRPGSPLFETTVLHGPDRRAVIAKAKALINRKQASEASSPAIQTFRL